jgi:hypothetical protein
MSHQDKVQPAIATCLLNSHDVSRRLNHAERRIVTLGVPANLAYREFREISTPLATLYFRKRIQQRITQELRCLTVTLEKM